MTPPSLPETVPVATLAGLLGVTARQARNLLEQAEVKSTGRGAWPLSEAIRAILADARRNRETDALAAARTRIVTAKARQLETAIDERARELIPLNEAIEAQDELVATVREVMDGLPARITRDLELRRKIRNELEAAKVRIQKALGVAHDTARNGPAQEV